MGRCAESVRRSLIVGCAIVSIVSGLVGAGPADASRAAGTARMVDPLIYVGQRPTVAGRVGNRVRPILLQRHVGTSWVNVARGSTSGTGEFRLRDGESRTGRYRALAPRRSTSSGTLLRWVSPEVKVNWQTVLEPGDVLYAERAIRSSNGRYQLVMQGDGNLVVYDTRTTPSTAIWSAQTQGADHRAVMQTDGNLVVYAGATPRWSSGTAPGSRARLVLQNDGNLVMYSRGGIALWASYQGLLPNTTDTITSGTTLYAGRSLWSRNGENRAVMHQGGNFVVYRNGQAQWSTGTSFQGSRIVLQGDGNLVVYDGGTARWSSGTAPAGRTRLVLQDDGDLVLYSRGGLPLWSSGGGRTGYAEDTLPTGTGLGVGKALWSHDGRYQAVMQGDGNFVVYGPSGPTWASGTSASGATVHMQGDGNLVVYAPGGGAVWASNTSGAGARLVMQDDGNLVVYASSGPTWSSQGGGPPPDVSTGGYPDHDAADCSGTYGIYSWCKNGTWYHPVRRFAYRNCTDYVAWKRGMVWGDIQHNGSGHASEWKAGWHDRGRTVSTVPQVGAVAWWGATSSNRFGHVAYVLRVNADGSAHVGEYNGGGNGKYGERDVRAPYYLY